MSQFHEIFFIGFENLVKSRRMLRNLIDVSFNTKVFEELAKKTYRRNIYFRTVSFHETFFKMGISGNFDKSRLVQYIVFNLFDEFFSLQKH